MSRKRRRHTRQHLAFVTQNDPALNIAEGEVNAVYRAYMEAGCLQDMLPIHEGERPAIWHIHRMNHEARCYADGLVGMDAHLFGFRCVFDYVEQHDIFDEQGNATATPRPTTDDFERSEQYGRMLKMKWLRDHDEIALNDIALVSTVGRMLSEGKVPFARSSSTSGGRGANEQGAKGNGEKPSTTPDPASDATTA